MTLIIRPIERDDIAAVSKFLTSGFATLVDAEFAAPDVLEWKYFDSIGDTASPRGLIAFDREQIVSFVGICPTSIVLGSSTEHISAGHGMDWLASRAHPAVGVHLYNRANESIAVPFVIGGTPMATEIRKRMGWTFPVQVSRFCRILKPLHRLRRPTDDVLWKALLKIGRDYARQVLISPQAPKVALELKPIEMFGDEVEQISRDCGMIDVHTRRTAALLNHFLRYPRAGISGWLIMQDAKVRGYAMLSVLYREQKWLGRIVDCFMDCPDYNLWYSALHNLTRQLGILGADLAECYGSTSWMERALRSNGYHFQRVSPLAVRDVNQLIPKEASFFLTALEGDHGFL
jgi:hypothetical protein